MMGAPFPEVTPMPLGRRALASRPSCSSRTVLPRRRPSWRAERRAVDSPAAKCVCGGCTGTYAPPGQWVAERSSA